MSRSKTDRTKNRSDRYQWVLIESPCSPEMLTEFSDSNDIVGQLNPFAYNEEELELKDKLKECFWRLVNTKLTERQREVITLYCQKYTQTEIAKKLNVNQSSITKSINGNSDYRKNEKKTYGGTIKKLKKLSEQDDEIKAIISRLSEISESETF